MLRIDREAKSLIPLDQKKMCQWGLTERGDVQQMVRNSPEAFFEEMGERLLLIGEEVKPSSVVEDRIDLLAIDEQGATVVIELKRGSRKLHLLQALSYASMIAEWDRASLLAKRSTFAERPPEDVEEEVEEFLLEDIGELNETQRIVLIADGFDYQVLMTAKWLTEAYGMDVRCYRLVVSGDCGGEFLSCTCIYPPPEITAHSTTRVRTNAKKPPWASWDDALKSVENQDVIEYFRRELDQGRENYLRGRALRYRFGGHRRFNVHARRKFAYVWQRGRFEGDLDFWQEKLGGEGSEVQPVKGGRAVRFYLSTTKDFQAFSDAYNGPLAEVEFSEYLDETDDEGLE